MITRRNLITATVAIAVAATIAAPAAEITTRRVRLTWTGGAQTQVDYQDVPAAAAPWVGGIDFGGGVMCVVEVVE